MFQPFSGTRYIDPSNVTGGASDSNTGVNPTNSPPGTGPILTTVHLNSLLFFRELTGDTTIVYLSDDTTETPLFYAFMNLQGFNLTFNQTRQVLHTGGTLNAGTVAINPTSNQSQLVHTSDVADFTPYVVAQLGGGATYGVRVTDTVTGAGAWVMSAATITTPKCTRPLLNDGTDGLLTSGDAYTLTRGGRLTLALQGPPLLAESATITFNDCAFDSGSAGTGGVSVVAYNRCTFSGLISVGGTLTDCLAQADIVEAFPGPLAFTSGGLITNGDSTWSSIVEMTGDLYATGVGLSFGGGFIENPFVFNNSGTPSGVQIQDSTGGAGLTVFGDFQIAEAASPANPLIWGTGNTGYGVLLNAGSAFTVPAATPPIITGTTQDFAFIGPDVGAVAQARAFDETASAGAGAYTALRTTTWANFSAAIGSSGFGFQAHSVSAGSSLVGV